jgi:hypothetical protein
VQESARKALQKVFDARLHAGATAKHKNMHLNHITWGTDSLCIRFAHTKTDVEGGDKARIRHVFANPYNLDICVVTALAKYLSFYPPKENGKLDYICRQYFTRKSCEKKALDEGRSVDELLQEEENEKERKRQRIYRQKRKEKAQASELTNEPNIPTGKRRDNVDIEQYNLDSRDAQRLGRLIH